MDAFWMSGVWVDFGGVETSLEPPDWTPDEIAAYREKIRRSVRCECGRERLIGLGVVCPRCFWDKRKRGGS